jgi:hypothetical protein
MLTKAMGLSQTFSKVRYAADASDAVSRHTRQDTRAALLITSSSPSKKGSSCAAAKVDFFGHLVDWGGCLSQPFSRRPCGAGPPDAEEPYAEYEASVATA